MMQDQKKPLEQEVNLRDYINVIVKWKILIIAFFMVPVIIYALARLNTPKIYDISMLIEPAAIGIADSGSCIYIDSPASLKARIDAGAFDSNVINALALGPQESGFKLNISQHMGSMFLKFSISEPESRKELGLKILNQFFNELSDYYKGIIEARQKEISKRILITSSRIKSEKELVAFYEGKIGLSADLERQLVDELKAVKVGPDQLRAGSEAQLPAYSNTMRQKIAYINQINIQLADISVREESIVSHIKSQQSDIGDLNIEIEKMKAAKSGIKNITLIQSPRIALNYTTQSRGRNIVFVGILSLAAGIVLAFFIDHYKNIKK
jgi:hypothetical protein